MREAGWNLVRFRVWNDPKDGWCDKAQGLRISLDFHYSDGWADPAKQRKPADWKDLSFDRLVAAVHYTTKDVVGAMVAQGTPPVMVQVDNEITPGMLWLDGSNDTPEGWRRLGRLVKAGCAGVKESGRGIRTMIHLDRGADNRGCRGWFDHLKAEGVDFDLIGLSYYPWWHGPLDDLRTNLVDLSTRYRKDLYVVETSYPWEPEPGAAPGIYKGGKLLPAYPASPQGQAAYLRKLTGIVRDVPGDRGKGLLYWAPTWISTPGRLERPRPVRPRRRRPPGIRRPRRAVTVLRVGHGIGSSACERQNGRPGPLRPDRADADRFYDRRLKANQKRLEGVINHRMDKGEKGKGTIER